MTFRSTLVFLMLVASSCSATAEIGIEEEEVAASSSSTAPTAQAAGADDDLEEVVEDVLQRNADEALDIDATGVSCDVEANGNGDVRSVVSITNTGDEAALYNYDTLLVDGDEELTAVGLTLRHAPAGRTSLDITDYTGRAFNGSQRCEVSNVRSVPEEATNTAAEQLDDVGSCSIVPDEDWPDTIQISVDVENGSEMTFFYSVYLALEADGEVLEVFDASLELEPGEAKTESAFWYHYGYDVDSIACEVVHIDAFDFS